VVGGVTILVGFGAPAQTAQSSAVAPRTTLLATRSHNLEDALLEWPLPPGEQAYGKIDGKRLHQYVEQQAAISRRYRDRGHPKFWGRIIGTSADAEGADWLANTFHSFGMSDVRIQPLDLGPQWFPDKSDVTVTGGGKALTLDIRRSRTIARLRCHRAVSTSKPCTEDWEAPPTCSART
jgi:hypothetical protein